MYGFSLAQEDNHRKGVGIACKPAADALVSATPTQ